MKKIILATLALFLFDSTVMAQTAVGTSKIDPDENAAEVTGYSYVSKNPLETLDLRRTLSIEAARLKLMLKWLELIHGPNIKEERTMKGSSLIKNHIEVEYSLPIQSYSLWDYMIQNSILGSPRYLNDGSSVEISAKLPLKLPLDASSKIYPIQRLSIPLGEVLITPSCQVYLLDQQENLVVKKALFFNFINKSVVIDFSMKKDDIYYSFCTKAQVRPTVWGAYVDIERVAGEVTSGVLESQNHKVSKESLIVFNQAIYTHPEAIQVARQWLQQGKTSIAAQLLGALPVASIPQDLRAYLPSQLAVSQHRTALVIGNANYTKSPLKNPLNDARALAQSLRQVGFEVIYKENLPTRGKMLEAMREFGASIKSDSTALFFYAGHAVQIDRENYLLPTQLDPTDKDQLKDDAVSIHRVLEEMERKGGIKILMLDACRDNPFGSKTRSISQSRGLTVTEPPRNTVIMYATKADQTAEDSLAGTQHSPFTHALIENLKKPGVSLQDLFASIQEQVDESTKGKQTPALYTEMKMSTLKKWSLH